MGRPERRDATGRPIRVGDWVRVLAIPDLGGLGPGARRETTRVFRRFIGRYRRVAAFSARGLVELGLRIRTGRDAGLHSVWIEPELLRVRRPRRRSV